MRRPLGLLPAIALILALAGGVGVAATAVVEVSAVGFASCNMHEWDQSFWSTIARVLPANGTTDATEHRADGFVWLGDVVYADRSARVRGFPISSSVENIRRKLTEFAAQEQYLAFVQNAVFADAKGQPQVTGVWDDHDMGKNDAGREFELREASEQLFLDFLRVPADHPRRQRRGVYHLQGFPLNAERAKHIAAMAQAVAPHADFGVCALLLDARFDRDEIGSDGDMLGEEQWEWLAKVTADPSSELGPHRTEKESGGKPLPLWDRCMFTVIGSGVQVLGDEKPTEHWGHFPTSRQRLLSMLYASKAARFAFISGDVHYADLQVEPAATSPFGFPLADATSSGLTHAVGDTLPCFIFDYFCDSTRRVDRFLPRNFGRVAVSVDADSGEEYVNITLHALRTGDPAIEFAMPLRQMAFKPTAGKRCGDACALHVQSGRLKRFLFWFRDRFAPGTPVHKLLLGFVIVTVLLVAGILTFCVHRSCRAVKRRFRRAPKVPPKKED
jgi:alkaline phosphatase D